MIPLSPFGDLAASRVVLKPIAWWKITLGFVLGLVVAAAVATTVWFLTTPGLSGKDLASARLDAVKVGLSVGVGLGGAFGLYLALRRQRATEADLDNRERVLLLQKQVAATTEEDAAVRRVNDLYTKAADQLGSEKAPVRLAGLYAFERLAQDNPAQPHLRQTVVNVICAYLRMPFTLPADDLSELSGEPEGGDADALLKEQRERQQEREVRLAAQRILRYHLRHGDAEQAPETFWENIDIDLTSSTLINFDLHKCRPRHVRFDGATFVGSSWFGDTTFIGQARFSNATFDGQAKFGRATFEKNAWFDHTKFASALFDSATFSDAATFTEAQFTKDADFGTTIFRGAARFARTIFSDRAKFVGCSFAGDAQFVATSFIGRTNFDDVTFSSQRKPGFGMATFEQGTPKELQQFMQTRAKPPAPAAPGDQESSEALDYPAS
ncbi:pentapeptide repeat-containing protein [Amycolatopsis japonica]|uniref:pentapeptide repeat-containing protein n=1 Tax=Amycolatopsis japonica TaxID=208439 RepID=UPI00378C08B0